WCHVAWIGPLPEEGPFLPENCLELAGEDGRHAVDGVLDVARQGRDRHDHHESDDRQDDAVLGHRLTVLALLERLGRLGSEHLRECEELQHSVHLPSLAARAHGVARFATGEAVRTNWKGVKSRLKSWRKRLSGTPDFLRDGSRRGRAACLRQSQRFHRERAALGVSLGVVIGRASPRFGGAPTKGAVDSQVSPYGPRISKSRKSASKWRPRRPTTERKANATTELFDQQAAPRARVG